MTTRRDGWSRRSRKNRPPRSRDAELDFAGTTAPWTPPRWRWPSRLRAFRDGCVRTKGQAAASSLQARAKCSTAYWYEPNALAIRADPPLHTVYSGTDPGQYLQLGNLADWHELARLLFKCNRARSAAVFASEPQFLRFLPALTNAHRPANVPMGSKPRSQTFYDARGSVVGRSHTDTGATTTYYDRQRRRAERHSHQSAPARTSASRAARCDALHLPCRDFSSMVTSLRRCSTSVSGTPAFTPRFLRIAPLFAEDATGSHICNGDRHRRSRPLYRIDRLRDRFLGHLRNGHRLPLLWALRQKIGRKRA